MSERIVLLVDTYKKNVKDLKSEAEQEILDKPAQVFSGDVPGWISILDGCEALLGAMDRFAELVLISAQDFETSADFLIEADQV